MKVWQAAVLETIRLAAAVLLYAVVSPAFKDLVPAAPIIGEAVAAVLCASIVLTVGWIVTPFGRVVAVVERYENSVPHAGPQIDLTCSSHTAAVAHYGVRVRYEYLGLIGRKIGSILAAAGLELAFTVNTDLLVLHSESTGADEERLDDGVVISLPEKFSKTTWQHVTVSVDSKEVPAHVDLDVATALLYPNVKPWYGVFVWSTSPVKCIKLMLKGSAA